MRRTSALLLLAVFLPMACAVPAPVTPSREVDKTIDTMLSIPPRLEKKKWPAGTIAAIEKSAPAPFPGIILSEARAKSVAKLRIAYDLLYREADANRRFSVKVINLYKSKLKQADAVIDADWRRRNSWWSRSKVGVAVAVTVVLLSGFFGLSVWAVSELKK